MLLKIWKKTLLDVGENVKGIYRLKPTLILFTDLHQRVENREFHVSEMDSLLELTKEVTNILEFIKEDNLWRQNENPMLREYLSDKSNKWKQVETMHKLISVGVRSLI